MGFKDPEEGRNYQREWKRLRREKLGLPARGKWKRAERTPEQIEESRRKKREYQKQYYKERPYKSRATAPRLFWAAKRRAKDRGLEFNITPDDIIIPTHCPYLGIPLVKSQPRGSSRRDVASLDRVNTTQGYIKGNIEVISHLANTMKSDATPELLLAFGKELVKRYS